LTSNSNSLKAQRGTTIKSVEGHNYSTQEVYKKIQM